MYYIFSKLYHQSGSEKSNNSPLPWKNNLEEKAKGNGTLQVEEKNAGEKKIIVV
jgi:hypothetical protein